MSIKISYNGETHIVKNQPEEYSELIKVVATSFPRAPSALKVFYLDEDNDQITISCNSDLVAFYQEFRSQNKVPKLIVSNGDGQAVFENSSVIILEEQTAQQQQPVAQENSVPADKSVLENRTVASNACVSCRVPCDFMICAECKAKPQATFERAQSAQIEFEQPKAQRASECEQPTTQRAGESEQRTTQRAGE